MEEISQNAVGESCRALYEKKVLPVFLGFDLPVSQARKLSCEYVFLKCDVVAFERGGGGDLEEIRRKAKNLQAFIKKLREVGHERKERNDGRE